MEVDQKWITTTLEHVSYFSSGRDDVLCSWLWIVMAPALQLLVESVDLITLNMVREIAMTVSCTVHYYDPLVSVSVGMLC